MSNNDERIIPDEPQARSIAREGIAAMNLLDNDVVVAKQNAKDTGIEEERSAKLPMESGIRVHDYDCDLVREYERSNGHCFLVVEDCGLESVIQSIDKFLLVAQEKGKVTAVTRNNKCCWDCQLYCGQALIRIAEMSSDKTLVQVHRCSGCSYGTHMIRKKLFQFLKGSEEPSFLEVARRVPFDFLECTAAMRKEFQDRCRSLLESKHTDRRELAKQALDGLTQETEDK